MAARDSIVNNVNNLRNQTSGHKNYVHVQTFNAPNQTPQQRYKPLIQAAVAWQRHGDALPNKDKEQIAAAAIIIAQKRGIQPDSNGNYPAEELNKSLTSPDELLRRLSSHYLNDAQKAAAEDKKEQATEEARNDIISSINEVYQNEDAPQTVIQIAQQAKPYIAPEATVDMGENEYNQATVDMDPADKARADELRRQSDEENRKAAARINPLMDDPDWGHKKDDDDFKIEQGDIIEYLMKEVILASVAWTGNKIAGGAGTILYEGFESGAKVLLPWVRDRKTAIAQGWDNLFNDNPSYQSLTGNCNTNINNLKKDLNDTTLPPKQLEQAEQLKLQLINHVVVIDQRGLIDNQGNLKSFKDLKTTQSDVEKLQETYDMLTLNIMLQNMGVDENDTAKQQQVQDWLKKHNEYQETCLLSGQPYNIANIPEPKSFLPHLVKAREELTAGLAFQTEKNLLQTQTELFAETYLKYRLEQENRNDPENPIFSDRQKSKKFIEEEKLKARQMFLTAEKARRQGHTQVNGVPLMSREGMLEKIEKMAEKAETESVQDSHFAPLVSGQEVKQSTVTSLLEAAQKADPTETYAAENKNLDMQLQEAQNRVVQTDEDRKRVEETKKRITEQQQGLDTKASTINSIRANTPNARPIPLRNRTQNQGGH